MTVTTSARVAPGTVRGAKPTIAAACLATVILMLDISVVNTALDRIAGGLDTGLSGLQWVVDAYTLPLAAVVLSAGSIADRFGRKRTFLAGTGVFTLSSAVCAAAPGIAVLVAARAVQGIGAAVLFATALALISEVTPTPEQRAKALGVFGAAIGASFAVGPFVGGLLTETAGWRSIFWVNVPLGVATALLARGVAESRDPHARRLDLRGQVTLAGGLFLLVLALLRGNVDGWGSTEVVLSFAGAGVLLVAFVLLSLTSPAPMLPLALLRQPRFTGPQVLVLGISASFFAAFLYLTLYLQGVVGLSPLETGLAYLPGTLLIFVVSGMTAGLMVRVSPAVLAVAGLALVALGLLVMSLTTGPDSGWAAIVPGFLVTAAGTGLVNPTGSALALQALPPSQSGLASGANDTFRQTGVAVGIAWLGTFVPAEGPYGVAPEVFTDGVQHTLLAAAVLAFACTAATAWLLLGKERAYGVGQE